MVGFVDRGPGGGTLDYATRAQRFTLDVDANTGAISNFKIVQTVVFGSNGNAAQRHCPQPQQHAGPGARPEGIVVPRRRATCWCLTNTALGARVHAQRRAGAHHITPANLIPRNAGTGTPNFAGDTGNTAGKRTNRAL